MGKPSIFSRDYEKRMKVRRRNSVIIVVVIALLVAALFLFGGISTEKFRNIKSSINKWIENDNKKNNSAQKSSTGNSDANSVKKAAEEPKSGYDITLSDNNVIKAVYETKDNTKKFKYIEPVSSNIPYSISSSGNAILIFDAKAQNVVYVTIDGKVNDITKKEYAATDGTVFAKESVLKNNPNYIWCATPVFVDDNNVVYISQLPWFDNRGIKYVWIVNIPSGTHKQVLGTDGSDLGGQNVKLGGVSDKGVNVSVNDKNYFIKSDGSLTE